MGNESIQGKPSWLTFERKPEGSSHNIYATSEASPGEVILLHGDADGRLTLAGDRASTGGNGAVASDLVRNQLFVGKSVRAGIGCEMESSQERTAC